MCAPHAAARPRQQDKNPDNRAAAEAKFKDVAEAYDVRCALCLHMHMRGCVCIDCVCTVFVGTKASSGHVPCP
jgi:hypothetical protein